MSWEYSNRFFLYIERGALRSARVVVPLVRTMLDVSSVVDVGCGRGAWLAVWKESGVKHVRGLDGDYVDRASLLVDQSEFASADLSKPVTVSERFSLAQCLEVAEHLPPASGRHLVRTLADLSDIVFFSAAVPGQGGEHHVNEREPEFWRREFALLGYAAFDVVRPLLVAERGVEPWYRYNSILYANAAGRIRLRSDILLAETPAGVPLRRAGNASWKLRLAIVRILPRPMATALAQLKARVRTILN